MAKVTSKLQITLPKRIAEQHGIAPGDEIEFVSAGELIHIVPRSARPQGGFSTAERLRLFDQATDRLQRRAGNLALPAQRTAGRDWQREDLYTRGKPR